MAKDGTWCHRNSGWNYRQQGISIIHFKFRGSLAGKESACNAGDPGLIPGLGRPAAEGLIYTLQYCWASLVAQQVKKMPAMWQTWV